MFELTGGVSVPVENVAAIDACGAVVVPSRISASAASTRGPSTNLLVGSVNV